MHHDSFQFVWTTTTDGNLLLSHPQQTPSVDTHTAGRVQTNGAYCCGWSEHVYSWYIQTSKWLGNKQVFHCSLNMMLNSLSTYFLMRNECLACHWVLLVMSQRSVIDRRVATKPRCLICFSSTSKIGKIKLILRFCWRANKSTSYSRKITRFVGRLQTGFFGEGSSVVSDQS